MSNLVALLLHTPRPLTLERSEHTGIREATVETARYARQDHRVLALVAVSEFVFGAEGVAQVLIAANRLGRPASVGILAGTYTTPAIHVEVSAVFSNTACNGPYRGSGRPEASYLLERLIDNAAREMKLDRAEIRRRNTIRSFPFKTGLIYHYDCGDFAGNLDFCIAIRTILLEQGKAYIQAGAGIVADSNPTAEYEETRDKARAMIRALELAQGGL